MKLTDTQLVVLAAAAARTDGSILPLPAHLKGGAVSKVCAALVAKGLAIETNGDTAKTLVITRLALEALGIEPEPAPIIEPEPALYAEAPPAIIAEEPKPRRAGTKQAQLIAMLEQPEGASTEEVVAAFGWQPHTVRGAGSMAFGLYASPEYLERHGEFDVADGCPGHQLVAQLDDIQDAPQFQWLADLTPRARIAFRTSSHEAAVSAAVHGAGLACLARFRADHETGLVRLAPPIAAPTTGIWLVVHRDNRDTTRIRAVMTHIADQIRSIKATLMPEGSAEADPKQDGRAREPSGLSLA